MKKHTTLAAFAFTALFAVTSACGGTKAPPKEDFPALGQPARLSMLANDGDGKIPLRWKAEKGVTESLSMVLDTKMEIKAGGQTIPMNMAMRMDMQGEVLDVLTDGSSVVRMTVEDASMDMPGMPAGGGDMFKDMLKGMTIESTLDPRGVVTGTQVSGGGELMAQLGDQMNSSFDQLALPFPEEAVGVGSKWQALTTQETNGMTVRMVATYEIVKLEGDKGTVKLGLQQFADKQSVEMGGTTAQLESLESEGSGSMDFDLKRPMFAKAELTLKMNAELGVMGESAKMKVDAKVSMTPKAGGAE